MYKDYNLDEGIAAEHPDIYGQSEFAKKADEEIARRRKARAKKGGPQLPGFVNKIKKTGYNFTEGKDHEYSMARTELSNALSSIKKLQKKFKGEGNIEAWVQSKITRAADYLNAASQYIESGEHNHVEEQIIIEREMTAVEKRRESKLKQKYDDSEMKQNMIDQYGKERGTQIYFAKIRKMAMENVQLDEFLNTGSVVAAKTRTLPGGKKYTEVGTQQKVLGVTMPGSFKPGASTSDVQRHNKAAGSATQIPTQNKVSTSQMVSGKGGHYVSGVSQDKPKPVSGAKMAPSAAKPQRTLSDVGRDIRSNIDKRNQQTSAAMQLLRQSFDLDGQELDEAKLSRTERRARNEGKPKVKGKVRAWDMDETLFRNDPKKIRVHVVDKSGKRVQSLTNQEFNVHKLDKEKGHSYDFGEFRSSKKFAAASTPNKSMIKKLKKQVKKGKPVHIVTARGSFDDQPAFAKHLRKHGIEIDPNKAKGGRYVHVHRAGDMPGGDIGQKKVDIVKGLMKKHGTKSAEMYDDAAKVHRAFKKSGLKVKTKMVQPNQGNVTQSRSFREDYDINEIYALLIEQLLLQGYANTNEEAENLIETFTEDLLVDLIVETLSMSNNLTENNSIKINYESPYKNLSWSSVSEDEYEEVEQNLTPYEYWKHFIGDAHTKISNEEVEQVEDVLEEEIKPSTSYEYWKKYLEQ